MEATLRKPVEGRKPGEIATMLESELWTRIQFGDHSILCPNSALRFECVVSGCTEECQYVSPDHWCQAHWDDWWHTYVEHEHEPKWMDETREGIPVITMKQDYDSAVAGTVVEPGGDALEERLMIRVQFVGQEKSVLVDRVCLSIECERLDCKEEAGTWSPFYHCVPHWDEFMETMTNGD